MLKIVRVDSLLKAKSTLQTIETSNKTYFSANGSPIEKKMLGIKGWAKFCGARTLLLVYSFLHCFV